ncbi:MAG: efflux RND transporter permease subunit, partial [Bacteroidetes bacterium]|nr:efflux RND transporter permease subunit [Bacteroidota bacterium]
MIDISFKNPLLIVVFALIVAIFSLVAISKLPIDILPKFKTSAVQVLTLYPGMPAEVMEKDITSRIERWTGQAEGISRQESKTMIGVSVVRNFFREEIDPNTAMSHVTSFAMSDLYYLPPGTLPPMIMPYDPTASIPLALLTVSSEVKNEKELYDIAYFNLRNLLGGIQGIVAPAVYGGKLTRIYVYVDPDKLEARNLSATDVMEAIQADNVMIPTGDANIGNMNYSVNAKGMLTNVEDFDDIIIKWQDGAPIYVRDIGHTENAGAIQTNIVRVNGKRQVYIPIYKRPGANTIAAVEGVKSSLDQLKSRLDPSIELNVIFDQSSYVRKSINGLKRAGIEGLILVTLMLFVFLGNVRSALIVVLSLPLAIMFTFIAMYFTGETINSMTLGGIALAIGLLVDNAIVVLENTDRHLKMGKTANQAAMDAVKEVAMPVFASTLVIIIVFLPIIFLTGITKYLFSSLAISVTFAMVGSYIFSMTLVPIAAARFFKDRLPDSDVDKPKSFFGSMSGILDRPRELYLRTLKKVLRNKGKVLAFIFALLILSGFVGRNLGYELFPKMDVGQLEIYARLEPGTRLENTEEVIAEIEDVIIDVIGDELNIIVSNIGVFYDWPAAYTPNSGTQDAFIKVQLKKGYKTSTFDYVKILRPRLVKEFPGVELSFNTGGIVTAALNYGLPSPIDIQVIGNDLQVANKIAREIRDSVRLVRGTRDVRILQRLNQPSLDINIDRIKASEMGVNASSAVKNIVASLNSTTNFLKSFWINEVNGNHYFVGVTYPEYEIDNQTALENVIITGQETTVPVRLKNIATITR